MEHQKDILFYSNFCDYSKDVLNLIIKKNIRQYFVLVCVDNSKYKLPEFVDRVPIIYTSNGDVLYDDYLFKYLESASTTTDDIQPFAIHQSLNYSDTYSFLDDTEGGTVSEANKAYTILGRDQHIIAVPEQNNETKKGGFDNSMLDRYMQAREDDDMRIKKNINASENYGRL